MTFTKTAKSLLSLFLVVALIGAIVFVFLNIQKIRDYITLYGYTPSADIATIRNDLRLTAVGETIFYVNDPQIVDKTVFTNVCPTYEATIVLGCYHSSNEIYIFDIEDSQVDLQGVEEVTAAHELLHAAYDRLSEKEKAEINEKLLAVYNSLDDSSDIKKNIDDYRKQGDDVVPNEMHSIIGTEVYDLPEDLEEYYARYFEDRKIIVDIAEQYADVFRSLERQIETYDKQLRTLTSDIDDLEKEIGAYKSQLSAQSQELDSLRDDPQAFNSKVGAYNNTVRAYNTTVEEYKNKISSYNGIVKKRNDISAQQTSLYDAIDANSEEVAE